MSERFTPDVMLLAAGRGTRMAPLTDAMPKPLVPVGGMPLIDRMIAALAAEGCQRFVANAHHLGEQIETHLEAMNDAKPGYRFRLSTEDMLMDTGGGVQQALPLLETNPVLVANTDAFWLPEADRPIARMLDAGMANSDAVILLCVEPARASGFRREHDFHLGSDHRIGEDGAPVIYAGVALLPRCWFAGTPETPYSLTAVFAAARDAGQLFGVTLEAEWFHVGDPEALAEAEARLSEPAV